MSENVRRFQDEARVLIEDTPGTEPYAPKENNRGKVGVVKSYDPADDTHLVDVGNDGLTNRYWIYTAYLSPAPEEDPQAALRETALRHMERERNQARRELEDFKQRVAEVAMDKASEHGWCETVENILENDLGLTVAKKTMRVEARVEFEIEVPCRRRDADHGFVRDSIRTVEVRMDDDFEDEVADGNVVEVLSYEEV